MGIRNAKQKIADVIADEAALAKTIDALPPAHALNALFSFLCAPPPQSQRAAAALGEVVSRIAATDMAAARVVMRRLMWHLNDESGGIGWGAAESMADIMIRCPALAKEYHHILLSYAAPGPNYIEEPRLQQEVQRAVKRLTAAYPEFVS